MLSPLARKLHTRIQIFFSQIHRRATHHYIKKKKDAQITVYAVRSVCAKMGDQTGL
jgi:hypothetical protein